jgi:hypothetical protein
MKRRRRKRRKGRRRRPGMIQIGRVLSINNDSLYDLEDQFILPRNYYYTNITAGHVYMET